MEPWYFEDSYIEVPFGPSDILNGAGYIFSNLQSVERAYSDRQIVLGLRFLIDASASDLPFLFFSENVDVKRRLDAIIRMQDVFQYWFEFKCEPILSNGSRNLTNPINSLCYMWWDILPRHGIPAQKFNSEIDQAILDLLSKILQQSNVACVESAVHGLGHWHAGYPDEVEKIFLDGKKHVPIELNDYLLKAKVGHIQ